MASNYGSAFCTSPPPLDTASVDDADEEDFVGGLGRLMTMHVNLDEDGEDVCNATVKWPFQSKTVFEASKTELDGTLDVPPIENISRCDDDFGGFNGHDFKLSDDSPAIDSICHNRDSAINVTSRSDDVPEEHSELSVESFNSTVVQDPIEENSDQSKGDGSGEENINEDDATRPESNEQEEYDDFASFQASSFPENPKNSLEEYSKNAFPVPTNEVASTLDLDQQTDLCDDPSADEFSDFQNARLSSSPPQVPSVREDDDEPAQDAGDNSEDQDFGNFATFDDPPCSSEGQDEVWGELSGAHSEDDQFGDFDSAQCCVNELQVIHGDDLYQLLSLAFPRPSSPTPSAVTPIISEEEDEYREMTIWNDLWDIMNTNALTYQWSQSHSNRMLLESLHVESRISLPNCGWNSSVPAFASTLTAAPLEPTKATLVGGKPVNPIGETTPNSTESAEKSNLTTIPPVRFDWNGSGLVNPLDGVDDEFLRATNSQFDVPQQSPVSSQSPIVQKILRDSTAKEGTRRPLSEEAQQVIASLPDLSFLGARVLMFPIRSQLP